MNNREIPSNPPPPYSKNDTGPEPARLNVDIPVQDRRSMEDEGRPIPPGWTRQWDTRSSHQFFVDTKATPPRSIWHHPYDDDAYLATLTSEQRERLQETGDPFAPAGKHSSSSSSANKASGQKQSFGSKMKDKITGKTHEERQADREARAEQERKAYEMHMAVRRAMTRAQETGQPQYVCKDRDGKDVYVEPPGFGGYGVGGGMNPSNYRGYSPYGQGPYSNPNVRYIRPAAPYSRPYGSGYGYGGYGYGGGMGMGMPLMGGLAGGLMLGGLMGGF